MSEKLKFYKGLEENLVNITIEPGAIYHCIDTGNTYIGVIDSEGEVLEDGTYPLKLDLYSTVSDIYIGDDEIEGGFELINADTLGGFPADEYTLKSHVYEKIDEININSYATKEEVNALTYEDIGAAPAGDYATKDDLNAIDFPIDSVNGKTGIVELVAEDVGAPTIEYAKKVGAPHNLLDNSDFRNPVNQRGATKYTASGYTIDRWNVNAGIKSFDVTNNGVSVAVVDAGNTCYFQQRVESKKVLGKKLTFAVKTPSGISVATGTYPTSVPSETVAVSEVICNGFRMFIRATATDAALQVRVDTATTIVFEWAALYEGEYTAETLPEYQPKGYAAELAECQRYFYRIKAYWKYAFAGMCTNATTAMFTIPIPQFMRIEPTMTIPDTSLIKIKCGNTGAQTPSADSYVSNMFASGNIIIVSVVVSGATAGSVAMLYFDNAGIIEFSADL